jgi:hypothetical protein
MFDSSTIANDEGNRKTVMRKALEAIDSLQARLDAIEQDRSEPIAIVGLSCRFPERGGRNAQSSGCSCAQRGPHRGCVAHVRTEKCATTV